MYSKDTMAHPYNEILSSIKTNLAAPALLTENDLPDIFFFNFYLFMIVTERERERERGRDTGRGRSRLHALGA